MTIVTPSRGIADAMHCRAADKAQAYRRVICEINHRCDPHFDSIRHIDTKWRNNLIGGDHAAMKWLPGYRQSFRSLRSAKATLSGIETIRTIKRGHSRMIQQIPKPQSRP